MLQHDYLLEIIGRFVESVSVALVSVFRDREFGRVEEAESAVAELLDLDASTAMSLAPQSLVTMMSLSGVGESVAGYAAYVLQRVSLAYELEGKPNVARVRHEQAQAIADAFNADLEQTPEEFLSLERQIINR